MKVWAKRTAVAAIVTLAAAGAALAEIAPGSVEWQRVMDIKLRAQEIQLKAGQASAQTEDSHARALIDAAAAAAQEIFDHCETLLGIK
jgi:hypothetical protein